MKNHFVLEPTEYTRDLNLIKHYHRDAATYLQKRTGKDFETCLAFVTRTTGPQGKMPINDPETLILSREDGSDRVAKTIPLSHYFRDVEQNKRIMSPTLAVYHHPKDKASLLSNYIGINIKKRKVSKNEMFEAETRGDKAMQQYKNNEQKSAKIKNNSLSGAQASKHTILRNKSAHSSLTSTCREATSYGNANNEKFLMGNRHYWCPMVVRANIISIINHVDLASVQKAMDDHGIRPPTVEETCACVEYSTSLYWRNEAQTEDIRRLIANLSDLERAAFVYCGDFYHLAQYNDDVARRLIDRLSCKASAPVDTMEEADALVKQMDGDLKAFVCLLCAVEMSTTDEKVGTIKGLRAQNEAGYRLLAATIRDILNTLDHYQSLIHGLWRVNTMPASIAHIRNSIRRSAVTSDTDSTIFTVQHWTQWFVGALDFSQKSTDVANVMVYLASQSIIHVLAKLSAGLGVIPEQIHDLNMKNEFSFPVFVLTAMAKHYFAYQSACEGNVYDTFKTEIKGVYLKDSNCPAHVMDEFKRTLNWTMDQIVAGKQISAHELLTKVATVEEGIRKSVKKGEAFYLTSAQVKPKEAYTNPMSANYFHYLFWQEVFAPKYGDAPEPPYPAIKASINIKNRTALNEWIDGMNDVEMAQRMRDFVEKYGKTNITSMILPRSVIEVKGMPEEIIDGMDIRSLIMGIVRPFYLLLESMGLYMMNGNNTRLVSDTITLEEPEYTKMLHERTA